MTLSSIRRYIRGVILPRSLRESIYAHDIDQAWFFSSIFNVFSEGLGTNNSSRVGPNPVNCRLEIYPYMALEILRLVV